MSFYGTGPGLHVLKDPDDVEDAILDFSLWLAGSTLNTLSVVSATGVTVDSNVINSGPLTVSENGVERTIATSNAVVLRLSGGTAGVVGQVAVRVIALSGRQRDVSFKVVARPS